MEHSARNDDVNALIILVILCLLGLIIISGCIFLSFWIEWIRRPPRREAPMLWS
jgi:hypothetical protein